MSDKTYSPEDYERAFQSFAQQVRELSKVMKHFGKAAKIANRDIIRASRRPPLIHNGGKP